MVRAWAWRSWAWRWRPGSSAGELAFDPVGLLAGLAAAVCFATYFLVGEHGVAELAPLRVMLWSFGGGDRGDERRGAGVGLPRRAARRRHLAARPARARSCCRSAVLVGWVVVLGTLVPFGVEIVALRHLPAATVTMVAMLEPVGVAALGWVWFGEELGLVAGIGCALVLAGILAAQTGPAAAPRCPSRRTWPVPERSERAGRPGLS